jgi:hypothetical protein
MASPASISLVGFTLIAGAALIVYLALNSG